MNAQEDYASFLAEYGFTAEEVRRISEYEGDQIPMPEGFAVELQDSPIEGKGMFATEDIEAWKLIAPARIGGMRTPAGRYTNHSPTPNAFFVALESGDLEMVAISQIRSGDEVVIDYRQAMDANRELGEAIKVKQATEILDKASSIEKVRRLEQHVLAMPQVDLGTKHVVHNEMCARTIFVPKDTILTGALTNIANMLIVSGDMTVTTDEGTKRLTGYNVIKAGAGFKRAGIAHEDTYVTTVWPTKLTDVEKIEDEMTDESAMLQTRRQGIVWQKTENIEVSK